MRLKWGCGTNYLVPQPHFSVQGYIKTYNVDSEYGMDQGKTEILIYEINI